MPGTRCSARAAQPSQADQIARLSWILFIGSVAVFLIVVVAAVARDPRPGENPQRAGISRARSIIGGIVFPAVVLSALLVSNLGSAEFARRARPTSRDVVPIKVVGEQWWWRVTYAARGVEMAAANEIRIPVGRDVVFTLQSADVIHSFWVPSLGGKVDMIPGRDTRMRVHADAARRVPRAVRGILRRPACADGIAGDRDACR